jgi:hypothetical protein
MSAPEASAATTSYGRVTVSGTNILVNGAVPSEKFFGVVETTALQFAILTYVEGESGVAGKTSTFYGPDTSSQGYIPQNANAEQFWAEYFALCKLYGVNLVRLGAGDTWGSGIEYQAWLNHRSAYIAFLDTMCEQAEKYGVWICFVLAGSQEYPTYTYGGSGSVFNPSSSAYANYISYCRDVMGELENENAVAMYDLFNEPDHNNCWTNYWSSNGGKNAFHTWATAVAEDTAGASTHPRTMGVAGYGSMFGWGQDDFDLATGTVPFEIASRHYYASNSDSNNFVTPEQWAKNDGKPLFWSELAYNAVYPLTRYTYGEQAIWAAGGQAITSMVLTGTSGYPYSGQTLPDPVDPAPLPDLSFTSAPVTVGTVGTAYSYKATTSIASTVTVTSGPSFLRVSSDGTVSGTPDIAGTYTVRLTATSSDGRTADQTFSLVVTGTVVPPVDGGDNTGGSGTDGGSADQGAGDGHNVVPGGDDQGNTGRTSSSGSVTLSPLQSPFMSPGYLIGGTAQSLLLIFLSVGTISALGIYVITKRLEE